MVAIDIPALGLAAILLAGVIAATAVLLPRQTVNARQRLEMAERSTSVLTSTATNATSLITRVVEDSSRAQRWAYTLDRAGIRRPLPEVLLILGAGTLLGFSIGAVLGGVVVGALLSLFVVATAVLTVAVRADRRRRQFADQLDDLLQLLASNLRAGHSLLQAMSSLAADVEDPARSELSRVVNQVRVGRDLGDAIDETASRMASDDFTWVAQAISIHRRVGGNLADVLDTVSVTIRERNQVRRQVRALSAEGRLSAVILMAMPVIVALILSFFNPVYLQTFTQSAPGFALIGLCAVLMTLGGIWLWRMVRVEY